MNNLVIDRAKFDKMYKLIQEQDLQEISFEFLVGSCFPHVLKNIQEEIRLQYTKGYKEGLEANQ